jgi:hypothetical protein
MAIVFSSLFVLLGLGAVGFAGLHAYVHRYDSARSVEAIPVPVVLAEPQPALPVPSVDVERVT